MLYWIVCLVKESNHCPAFSSFIIIFFLQILVQIFIYFLVFPFCLKNPNMLLSWSNYGPKFNFIVIKNIKGGPKIFLKVNKYKILNYYIYIKKKLLRQGGLKTTLAIRWHRHWVCNPVEM